MTSHLISKAALITIYKPKSRLLQEMNISGLAQKFSVVEQKLLALEQSP